MAIQWQGWVTVVTLVIGLIVMASDRVGPDFVFLVMVGVLLTTTVLDLSEALTGFSNSGLLTVMMLFPVAEGIAQTGGLDSLFAKLLGRPTTLINAQIRMMVPVAVLSAFLNNTPIVALLVPLIFGWARGSDSIHAQKLLIPLSYASILGGTCTLIGTSTNLVIAGLQEERAKEDPEVPVFGMFDITIYGFPYAICGILYILFFSGWLLPPMATFAHCGRLPEEEEKEELLVGLQVNDNSPVIGKTVQNAGLRSLDRLFLVSVERGGYPIPAVGPDFELNASDVLLFSGDLKDVKALATTHGLTYMTDETEDIVPADYFGSPRHKGETSPRNRSRRGQPADCAWRFSLDQGTQPAGSRHASPKVKDSNAESEALTSRELVIISAAAKLSTENLKALENDQLPPIQTEIRQASKPASPVLSPVHSPDVPPPWLPHGLMSGPQSVADFITSPAKGGQEVGHLVQASIRQSSALVGHSIRQAGFRGKFRASVVTVLRQGKRVPGKMGDIVLEPRDRVVMDVSDNFDRYGEQVQANFQDMEFLSEEAREFMAPMVVIDKSTLVGKSIHQAELRGLPGLFLVSIDRVTGASLHAVDPKTILEAGDCLWFSGDLEAIASLRKVAGLRHQEDHQSKKVGIEAIHRRLVQAVVASGSPLVGKTVRKSAFRTHYSAAILAVHRQGERLRCKIGDVVLKAGDVLLLDCGQGFVEKNIHDPSFALLAEVENSTPLNSSRMWIAVGFGAGMVLTQIIGTFVGKFMDLFTAALLAAGGMLVTGCLTGAAARSSINWDIFVCIGSAFGVSIAMEKTGVANAIAELLVNLGQAAGGEVPTLVAIYVATAFLSNIIANNAAAAIMFPISFSVAKGLSIDYNIMSVTLMLGASSCFFTPFGYQTNLMVFGAGGYRTMDFIRFGGPMQLWLTLAFTLIIYLAVNDLLWVVVAAAATAAGLIMLYPFASGLSEFARRKMAGHSAPKLKRRRSDDERIGVAV